MAGQQGSGKARRARWPSRGSRNCSRRSRVGRRGIPQSESAQPAPPTPPADSGPPPAVGVRAGSQDCGTGSPGGGAAAEHAAVQPCAPRARAQGQVGQAGCMV